VNETVRFHAVQTTFAQGMPESVEALIDLLAQEESVRVKNKIADGLLVRGWTIPETRRDAVEDALRDTSGYALGEGGKVVKRSFGFH
jgi:HEAT repeat protein